MTALVRGGPTVREKVVCCMSLCVEKTASARCSGCVRGEIPQSTRDKLPRKLLSGMFLVTKNVSWGIKNDQIPL